MQVIDLFRLNLKVFELLLCKLKYLKQKLILGYLTAFLVKIIGYVNSLSCLMCHVISTFVNIPKSHSALQLELKETP